jgi:hypothetical protein
VTVGCSLYVVCTSDCIGDALEGKNAANVGVDPTCHNLPTTMKAVVNAVIKSELWRGSNDVNGYRVVSLDNRYQCPQLAYLLWMRSVPKRDNFGL